MHARDSSGRQVSLLNEPSLDSSRSNSYASESSFSRTPDLLQAGSYDSLTSNDPSSPLTPSLTEYGRPGTHTTPYPDLSQHDNLLDRSSIYGSYPPRQNSSDTTFRPSYVERSTSSYDDDHISGGTSKRSGSSSRKRYPCRFKDSHGCDKSFTTSGHASRHSKIHTAERAVHCPFQDCQKKFTRVDNMRQHLETHYKERSRSPTSHRSSFHAAKLTVPASVKNASADL